MVRLKTFIVGYYQTNCYCLYDGGNNAVVIDPGDGAAAIAEYLRKNNLQLKAILLTHEHFDHCLGVNGLKKIFPKAEICYNKGGLKMLTGKDKVNFQVVDLEFEDVVADKLVSDNDMLFYGEMVFRVLYTPGHSDGSVCYICNDEYVFCGDLLFKNSYGATHFYGGNLQTLIASVKKVFALDGDKVLYCGHMEPTTLDYERKNNPINAYLPGNV